MLDLIILKILLLLIVNSVVSVHTSQMRRVKKNVVNSSKVLVSTEVFCDYCSKATSIGQIELLDTFFNHKWKRRPVRHIVLSIAYSVLNGRVGGLKIYSRDLGKGGHFTRI